MARTGGDEPPNDGERMEMMLDQARAGGSFTGADVVWLYVTLSGAITWDTTCLNCSNLLDQLYRRDMQVEKVREVCEHARKISPSDSMSVYVNDILSALGDKVSRPHKLGATE
jgi:hypothetical protein